MIFVAIILKISSYYYTNMILDTATRLDIYTYNTNTAGTGNRYRTNTDTNMITTTQQSHKTS